MKDLDDQRVGIALDGIKRLDVRQVVDPSLVLLDDITDVDNEEWIFTLTSLKIEAYSVVDVHFFIEKSHVVAGNQVRDAGEGLLC